MNKKMDPEVNDFAFGLKYTLLADTEKAIAILRPRLDKYLKKPPKGGYKRNYFTLTTALVGILEKDEELFYEGLSLQLHFHLGDAHGEYKNMPQGFICDDSVALACLIHAPDDEVAQFDGGSGFSTDELLTLMRHIYQHIWGDVPEPVEAVEWI